MVRIAPVRHDLSAHLLRRAGDDWGTGRRCTVSPLLATLVRACRRRHKGGRVGRCWTCRLHRFRDYGVRQLANPRPFVPLEHPLSARLTQAVPSTLVAHQFETRVRKTTWGVGHFEVDAWSKVKPFDGHRRRNKRFPKHKGFENLQSSAGAQTDGSNHKARRLIVWGDIRHLTMDEACLAVMQLADVAFSFLADNGEARVGLLPLDTGHHFAHEVFHSVGVRFVAHCPDKEHFLGARHFRIGWGPGRHPIRDD